MTHSIYNMEYYSIIIIIFNNIILLSGIISGLFYRFRYIIHSVALRLSIIFVRAKHNTMHSHRCISVTFVIGRLRCRNIATCQSNRYYVSMCMFLNLYISFISLCKQIKQLYVKPTHLIVWLTPFCARSRPFSFRLF